MFPTESVGTIQPISRENADSLVARKPGDNSVSSRNPFADRPINSKTPKNYQKLTPAVSLNKEIFLRQAELCAIDAEYLHRDLPDDEADGAWATKPLKRKDINNIVLNYCHARNLETPPPSDDDDDDLPRFEMIPETQQVFEIDPVFLDFPGRDLMSSIQDDSFQISESDFDELDMSI